MSAAGAYDPSRRKTQLAATFTIVALSNLFGAGQLNHWLLWIAVGAMMTALAVAWPMRHRLLAGVKHGWPPSLGSPHPSWAASYLLVGLSGAVVSFLAAARHLDGWAETGVLQAAATLTVAAPSAWLIHSAFAAAKLEPDMSQGAV